MFWLASAGWVVGVLAICGVLTVGLWTVVVENEGIPAAAAAPAMIPSVVTVAVGVRRTVSVASVGAGGGHEDPLKSG